MTITYLYDGMYRASVPVAGGGFIVGFGHGKTVAIDDCLRNLKNSGMTRI